MDLLAKTISSGVGLFGRAASSAKKAAEKGLEEGTKFAEKKMNEFDEKVNAMGGGKKPKKRTKSKRPKSKKPKKKKKPSKH